MTTRLQFEATIVGAKLVLAKEASNSYSQPASAHVELTLKVPAPPTPRKPALAWEFRGQGPDQLRPRPAELPRLQKGESESKEELKQRQQAELEHEQQRYDEHLARYRAELQDYRAEMAALSQRTKDYAMLVGIAAVFGNQLLAVEIKPANQDLLPGFEIDMLSSPDSAQAIGGAGFADPEGSDE